MGMFTVICHGRKVFSGERQKSGELAHLKFICWKVTIEAMLIAQIRFIFIILADSCFRLFMLLIWHARMLDICFLNFCIRCLVYLMPQTPFTLNLQFFITKCARKPWKPLKINPITNSKRFRHHFRTAPSIHRITSQVIQQYLLMRAKQILVSISTSSHVVLGTSNYRVVNEAIFILFITRR